VWPSIKQYPVGGAMQHDSYIGHVRQQKRGHGTGRYRQPVCRIYFLLPLPSKWDTKI
jgi:hypothetical protein